MAAIKYDVSDVEAGGGGEQPQPGMYSGQIVSMTQRKKKQGGDAVSDLEIVVDVGSDYARLWTYVKLPDDPNWDKNMHGWKLRELTDALGLPPKGAIDPAKINKEKPKVSVRVKADTDQDGDYRGKIKNLFKPGAASENGASPESSAEEEDYDEWTVEDLEAEIQEQGLTMPTGRKTKEKLISVLQADGATPEAEAEAEAEATTEDDYDEWTVEDLAAEIEEQGLSGNVTGRKSKQKYIDVLRAAAAGPTGDGDGDGGETTPEDDYDEWEAEELLAEIKDRKEQGVEIPVPRGPKSRDKDHLMEILRKDNAGEPF
jgi:hypothetical protein